MEKAASPRVFGDEAISVLHFLRRSADGTVVLCMLQEADRGESDLQRHGFD